MARASDDGTTIGGPLYVSTLLPSSREEVQGRSFRSNTRAKVHFFEDFDGPQSTYTLEVPLFDATNDAHTILVDADSRNRVKVPRAGRLIAAHLIAEDGLALAQTNFITFTATNELGSGSGTAEMLDTTDGANSTDDDETGAIAITAKVGRTFAISATAASLRVAEGDHILVTATIDGTPANAVDLPVMLLTFAALPATTYPRIVRTAGSPLVAPVSDSANGEAICQLSAEDEVNSAFLDWGDSLLVPANRRPIFEARVKMGTVTTAQTVVIGLASAWNATLDSIVSNLWFRFVASLAAVIEGDDGTTDTDDQAAVPATTITADTYYYFKIDASDLLDVKFYIDDSYVGSVAVSALDGDDLLQPIIGIQKASGVGEVSVTCDWYSVEYDRQA